MQTYLLILNMFVVSGQCSKTGEFISLLFNGSTAEEDYDKCVKTKVLEKYPVFDNYDRKYYLRAFASINNEGVNDEIKDADSIIMQFITPFHGNIYNFTMQTVTKKEEIIFESYLLPIPKDEMPTVNVVDYKHDEYFLAYWCDQSIGNKYVTRFLLSMSLTSDITTALDFDKKKQMSNPLDVLPFKYVDIIDN